MKLFVPMTKRMKCIRIRYVKYELLKPLFEIIESEKYYRVQLVSLEPFSTLIELFNYKKIPYNLVFSTTDIYKSNKVNIIIQNPEIDDLKPGKYILYSNKRNARFVQIVFRVSLDEKIRYFSLKHGACSKGVVKAHGRSKSISDIEYIISRKACDTPGPCISYIETIVLLCMKKNKFDKICQEARQIDSKLDNTFLIWITLNGLVNRNFVCRSGNNFRANISRESLEHACKKAEIDINLFR